MGYTYSFADNESYGASDINDVISKIVTGGVDEVFYNGLSYNTSDLNRIARYISTYGARDRASNTLRVIKDTDGRVKILAGTAFMHDGASVTVDGDGVVLDYVKGRRNYVYIQNNLALKNSIDFVCGLESGGSGTVPLAEISASGSIEDKRVYCKGKIAGYQSDVNQTKIISVPYSITANAYGKEQSVSVELGGTGYSRIVNMTSVIDNESGGNVNCGVYNLNDDTYYSVAKKSNGELGLITNTMRIYSDISSKGDNIVNVNFSMSGSVLTCTFKAYYGKSVSGTDTMDFSGTAKFMVC